MKDRRARILAACASLLLLCGMPDVRAADPVEALSDMSLEELANLAITSVSGHSERLSGAAASIYVITADDIRRAGVTSLPEALRLAPNLQVARVDAGQYAISARGFNNAIGNKLLVLIDGRTVYTSFFSGVFWDQQDLMLEDVERIEVISGPGGVLWGTNAVNGVINVVTRPATETRGTLAVAGGGNDEKLAAVRASASLGERGRIRGYVRRSLVDNTRTEDGVAQPDGWNRTSAGFRADWSGAADGLVLEGSAMHGQTEHRGYLGTFDIGPLAVSQVDLLARWTRRLSDDSGLAMQAYYDHFRRDDRLLYRPRESVFDLDLRHHFAVAGQRVLWGVGYRHTDDNIEPGLFFGFVPQRSSIDSSNVFAQDEINLAKHLVLTLGARLERNAFTGTEKLPSARLAWQVSPDNLLWTAASRAVRAPALLDRDIVLPPAPPYIIAGGPDFISEVANVYELGWRGRPTSALTLSVTGFYESWNRLRSGQAPPDALVQNMIYGHTGGVEAWGSWQVLSGWRLSGGVTTLHKDLRLRAESTDPVGPSNLGNDPDYQWTARSAFDLPHRQELDIMLRRVAALPDPAVPAYTALDARYGWHVTKTAEISLAVRNLLDPGHAEFNAPPRSEIGRSVMLELRWAP